ncbi:hypothetical protein SDC9_202118 [bioreactor metagenome]|uniref:Uncharacterized protein n=1 Tax=bioreactor metagenome TaxID=1076179 RepID=A0A645ISU6_9ZZZZ
MPQGGGSHGQHRLNAHGNEQRGDHGNGQAKASKTLQNGGEHPGLQNEQPTFIVHHAIQAGGDGTDAPHLVNQVVNKDARP